MTHVQVIHLPAPEYATKLTDGDVIGQLTVPQNAQVRVNRSEVAAWHDTLELVPGTYDVVWRSERGAQVAIDAFLIEVDAPVLFGGVRMTDGRRDGGRKPDTHHVGHSYDYQLAQLLEGGHTHERDLLRGGWVRERTFGGFTARFHGDLEVITTAVSVYSDHTHEHRGVFRVARHHAHDPAHAEGDPCEHGKLPWQGCMANGCIRGGCFEPRLEAVTA